MWDTVRVWGNIKITIIIILINDNCSNGENWMECTNS